MTQQPKVTELTGMSRSKPEARFEQYREALRVELMKLAAYVRLYRVLNERKRDRLAEMNLAPAFFTITEDAVFSAIVLWVDKLFDPQSKPGLINFLKFVEHNRKLFDRKELQRRQDFSEDHSYLMAVKPLTLQIIRDDYRRIADFAPLKSFKTRRDKYLAHFDKKYFFSREQLQKDAPIRWDDLEKGVELGKDILNSYSALYDGTSSGIEPVNAADVNHLLDRLHRSH
jgi:hypothetical protein